MSLTSAFNGPSFLRNIAICRQRLPSAKLGMDLLKDSQMNRGTAFTREERDRLHLRGILPHKVFKKDEQVDRLKRVLDIMPTQLLKYHFLSCERERNEQVYWRFLFKQNPVGTMPILYTPTVGEACQKWATIRPSYRGVYISPNDRGHIKDILRNYPRQNIKCIVVTDGGRILGLGDLGASGMGIPIGKLILYTLIGQVNPGVTLPVQLDMGTDRKDLLDDPLYHGWKHPRIRGVEHTAFVQEFIDAVKEVFGEATLVQFEDFEMEIAFKLLDHFRWRCCCFNDDIEGTASVTAAALATASRIKGVPALKDQKILYIGAGSAATGIADLVADMAEAQGGITKKSMEQNQFMFDKDGMVHAGRKDLFEFNKPYMHDMKPIATVLEACKQLKITAIIGVSGVPKLITKEIVEVMCQNTERPVVFALSNPTSKAECTAEQAYDWSNQKAIYASGSPFPEYNKNGIHFVPAQANNSWIFPGVGLALVATGARHCPPAVFAVAADALAAQVLPSDLAMGSLLPPMENIRDYSFGISMKVAEYLYKEDLATIKVPPNMTLEQFLKQQLFNPGADYEGTIY
jgi:malate dehydrogenase (oxaloacetate-decarboxylating)/malate dehydrogenase (oxaloacetate-decarboxylating)(NADP+)